MKKNLLEKVYLAGSGAVFLLVAIFHLLRLIYQVPVVVGTLEVPYLPSYVGLPCGLAAAGVAFWLVRKRKL